MLTKYRDLEDRPQIFVRRPENYSRRLARLCSKFARASALISEAQAVLAGLLERLEADDEGEVYEFYRYLSNVKFRGETPSDAIDLAEEEANWIRKDVAGAVWALGAALTQLESHAPGGCHRQTEEVAARLRRVR